jgi:hypothetical protein
MYRSGNILARSIDWNACSRRRRRKYSIRCANVSRPTRQRGLPARYQQELSGGSARRRSNQRRAAIRSPVVRRAERGQQRNRQREVLQPITPRRHSRLRYSGQRDRKRTSTRASSESDEFCQGVTIALVLAPEGARSVSPAPSGSSQQLPRAFSIERSRRQIVQRLFSIACFILVVIIAK